MIYRKDAPVRPGYLYKTSALSSLARVAAVSPSDATRRTGSLGLGLLVALVVGSIIGSGIFGLDQMEAMLAGTAGTQFTMDGKEQP